MKGRCVVVLMLAVVCAQAGRSQEQRKFAGITAEAADSIGSSGTTKGVQLKAAPRGVKKLRIASPSVRRGGTAWTNFAAVHDAAVAPRISASCPRPSGIDECTEMINKTYFIHV